MTPSAAHGISDPPAGVVIDISHVDEELADVSPRLAAS
jgi:hypothetical protein